MREKFKRFREKISNKISSSPTYKKFIRKRDELAEPIKNALLACFSLIGPVWNILFLKTQDPDESDFDEAKNKIRQDVIKNLILGFVAITAQKVNHELFE